MKPTCKHRRSAKALSVRYELDRRQNCDRNGCCTHRITAVIATAHSHMQAMSKNRTLEVG